MKRNFKAILFYIALIAIVVFSVSSLLGQTKQEKLLYSDIVDQFKSDSVVSFTVSEDYLLTMTVVDPEYATIDETTGKVTAYDESHLKQLTYQLSSLSLFHTDLEGYIAENANLAEYDYEPQTTYPWWISLIPYAIVIVIFIALWIFMMNQTAGGKGGKMNSFGKAHVKTPQPNDKNRVLFADVAGAVYGFKTRHHGLQGMGADLRCCRIICIYFHWRILQWLFFIYLLGSWVIYHLLPTMSIG